MEQADDEPQGVRQRSARVHLGSGAWIQRSRLAEEVPSERSTHHVGFSLEQRLEALLEALSLADAEQVEPGGSGWRKHTHRGQPRAGP